MRGRYLWWRSLVSWHLVAWHLLESLQLLGAIACKNWLDLVSKLGINLTLSESAVAILSERVQERTYWNWRGWRIHYVQQGHQGPCLLLVHGFGASTDHWRKNIAELSQQFRVWAIDLLGFGRSQNPR